MATRLMLRLTSNTSLKLSEPFAVLPISLQLKEPVMALDGPVEQYVFDSGAGADIVYDQVAVA